MAKIVRYGGNLKAFASEQQTNERTLFGDVTIANDLTSQINANFLRGWGIVGPSDQPSLQDFNAAMYTNGQLLAYLHQMGVAEYNATQEYYTGSLAQTGGVLYISLTDANTGNAPSLSPGNWKGFTADQATEVALGLVKIATQALVDAGTDDLSALTAKKLSAVIQGQKHTAFNSTGTATAQAISPVPAISGYSTGQRFNVTFNIASGANPTINVSARGAKNLKQYDPSGVKVSAVFAMNQNSDIIYDGTDFVLIDPLPPSSGLPVGAVMAIAGQSLPDGMLKANGAVVSRTTYANLFAEIGVVFGAGDGSTTFKLPDLRGEFIRGWDDGRGIDVSRVFGSLQLDELKSHTHTVTTGAPSSAVNPTSGTNFIGGGSNTGATGGVETRPRNVALTFVIKY